MKLDHLVGFVQKAAIAASQSLQEQNLKIIDFYFDEVEEEDTVKQGLKASLREQMKYGNMNDQDIDNIVDALPAEVTKMVNQKNGKLVPKTVTVQYPKITAKGPAVHEVTVPLLVLVPFTLTEVSNIKFTTELDVRLIDDELDISFPTKGTEPIENSIASLEINLDKSIPPDGLRKLIEGYDRALRAQIPG